MGELIELETAIERRLPGGCELVKEFTFEFKRCLLKAFSLTENGMSPKEAVVKSGFERVWVKEGHGRARPG